MGPQECGDDHMDDEPDSPPLFSLAGGQWLGPLLRGCDSKAYRGQLWQEHWLRQPVKYVRQAFQVIWLHIC